jgi:hypothetical protein
MNVIILQLQEQINNLQNQLREQAQNAQPVHPVAAPIQLPAPRIKPD